jgi:hypothetical protein
MISSPDFSSFRFYFPQDWLLPKTKAKIDKMLRFGDSPYTTAIDYLNSTITNAIIPGLTDPGTQKQTGSNNRTRTFASALASKEMLDKSINIDYNVKSSFINWVIMYNQMIEYIDREDRESKPFLPDVYLQILDEEDCIVMELIFKQIQIRSISSLNFSKKDNGLGAKDFNTVLNFNDFEINFLFDKTQSSRNSEDHEYSY